MRRGAYDRIIDTLPPLVAVALASASPRRRELLASLGLRVEVIPSAYVESPLPDLAPAEAARRHALGKLAGAAIRPLPTVAADTVVDLDGEIFEKPVDVADARRMLGRLAGRWHAVHTAFAIRAPGAPAVCETVTTRVRFADLDGRTLDAYAASGDGLDKAGAYGIQGFAATLVERIDGDYFTVVGFPLAAFARALPRIGYRLTPSAASRAKVGV